MQHTENASLREITAKRVRVLSQGTETLPIKKTNSLSSQLGNPEDRAVKTLDDALMSEHPLQRVQEIAPQVLYFGLKKTTAENLVQAMQYCSPEQWQRIVDYDCWNEDRLRLPALASWLLVYRAMDGEGKAFLERFKQLGDELQTASVCGQFDLINEDEYDKMPDHERDSFVPLPGHAGYYKTSTSDERMQEFFDALINSSFQNDMHYAFSILGHGAFSPPQESEYQAMRFRKARVEEDGFVDKDDALRFWKPTGIMRKDISAYCEASFTDAATTTNTNKGEALTECSEQGSFLDRCLSLLGSPSLGEDVLQQKLLLFANSIASAVGFEVYELGRSSKSLELAKGALSLGLEKMANRDPSVGAKLLVDENWQTLFQVGTGITDFFRLRVLDMLRSAFGAKVDQLTEFHETRSFGKALLWIDQELNGPLESAHCDLLRGLFNRFPLAGDASAASRGGVEQAELEVISDFASLRSLGAQIDAVLSMVQFFKNQSSVELLSSFEAIRSSLILSTRLKQEKSLDWGLTVNESDLARWKDFSPNDKAAATYTLLSRMQKDFPSVEQSMFAGILGDAVGGKQFSLMESGELFYAFG